MSRWMIVCVGRSANLCCMILYIVSGPLGRPTPYCCLPTACCICVLCVRCMAVAVMRRMAVPTASGLRPPLGLSLAPSCVVSAASRAGEGACPCCKRVAMTLRLRKASSSCASVAQCSLRLASGPGFLLRG